MCSERCMAFHQGTGVFTLGARQWLSVSEEEELGVFPWSPGSYHPFILPYLHTECLWPPKLICWHLNSQWDGIWPLRGDQVMNGVSALSKETLEWSFISSTEWGHREKTAACEPGSRSSWDTESPSLLILNFPACRTVSNLPRLWCPAPTDYYILW